MRYRIPRAQGESLQFELLVVAARYSASDSLPIRDHHVSRSLYYHTMSADVDSVSKTFSTHTETRHIE